MGLKENFHRGLDGLFGSLGELAASRPYTMITLSIFISLCLSAGITQVHMETGSISLWIPRDIDSYKNWKELSTNFDGAGGAENVFIVAKEEGKDIFDRDVLLEILEVHLKIVNTVEIDGKTFQHFCTRIIPEYPCDTWNMFSLWDYNATLIEKAIEANTAKVTVGALSSKVSLLSFLGGLETSQINGNLVVQKAQSIILSYSLQEKEGTLGWQAALIDEIHKEKKYIRAEIISGRSVDDEVQRLVAGDSMLFGISINVILTYLSLSLGKLNSLNARVLLAWSGVCLILLSLLVSFSVAAIAGYDLNSIVLLLSFILAGVGVDDIIVIVHYFDMNDNIENLQDRMRKSMIEAGAAITLTSLTAVLAFGSGVTVAIPGIQSFSFHAMVAFLWTFILSSILFPSFVVLDYRRVQNKRHALLPCCLSAHKAVETRVTKVDSKYKLDKEPRTVDKKMQESSQNSDSNSKAQVMDDGSYRHLDAFSNLILNPISKVVILVSFFSFSLFVVAFLLDDITVGLETRDVIPDDSYVNDAFDIYEKHWNGMVTSWSIVVKDVDYSDLSSRKEVLDFLTWYEGQSFSLPPIDAGKGSWLNSYLKFMVSKSIPDSEFYIHLGSFLKENPVYQPSVVCGDELCSAVKMSRFKITMQDPVGTTPRNKIVDNIQAELERRNISNKVSVSAVNILFSELDRMIPNLTVQNLASAVVVIFFTLLLFTNWGLALLISILVAMIDVDLLSLLVWWDIKLNVVSFTCLIMSVGLSVDYCVHIGHAYAEAGGTGNQRARNAIRSMGGSVVMGGLTTFVGVMTLSVASSDAFRTFFKMLFGTVIFGILHALILFPVILSLIGNVFVPSHCEHKNLHKTHVAS